MRVWIGMKGGMDKYWILPRVGDKKLPHLGHLASCITSWLLHGLDTSCSWRCPSPRCQRCSPLWAWPSCPWLYPCPSLGLQDLIIHLSSHRLHDLSQGCPLSSDKKVLLPSPPPPLMLSTILQMDLPKKMIQQELPLYVGQLHVPSDCLVTLLPFKPNWLHSLF